MAKNINRKVTIYINGKEVESTIKSLEAELAKLRNVQRSATLGSKEYVDASLKMKEIKSILESQKNEVKGIGESWDAAALKIANYSTMLMGVKKAQ